MYVKKIILITLLLCLPFFIYAQIINYQLINSGFESWETITYNNQSITEPVRWNGFKTGVAPEGSMLAIAMSAMPIQFEACSDVRPGSTGIKSIKTWSLDLGWYRPNLVANGLFTTGQVHMSSASYSDPNNYYGTLSENSTFHQPFTAMPDSIYFWAKYKTTAATQNATVHVYIHDSSNTHDPVPTAMTSNVVASVLYEWPRGEQQWQQHKAAFSYDSWTNQNPAYILITFFTSPTWGVGTPYDTLYVDDIELIYNRLLSDLQVNGATLPAFNNQITNYSVPLCQSFTAENLPVIAATAVSPHAVVTITQPALQNPNAVITVTHGGSSKIYTVHFTGNSTSSVHNAQLCQGYPYNGYGFNIPNPVTQQYSRTITGGNHIGCDSIIYLNLTVFPFYVGAQAITKYDTVCQGDNYNNYGFTLSPAETNTPGTITRTLNNLLTVNGCDSVVHLSLYVKPKNIIQISDRVCQETTYQQHGFNVPAATLQHTGTYNSTLHLANRFGCDSTVTLRLTVDSIFHTDLYDQICYGNNYVKHGFNLTDNHTAGLNTHEHILTSKQGCDSIVTLYLFVHPEYHPAPLYVKLCGSSGYDFYGQILDTAGTYTHTLTSQHGCDSIITLILEKEPKFRTLLTVSICNGETYNQHGFSKSVSGLDSITYLATNGCDSVVVLDLTVFPSYTGAQAITKYDTVCQGDNYNNYGFTLSPAETDTPGAITRTLNNLLTANGCDSVVHLSLYVKPQNIIQISDKVCQGTDYRQHGFNIPAATLQHTGTYNSTLHLANRFGCDSTVTLQLTVDSTFHTDLYDQICYGNNYVKHGFNLTDNHTAGLNTHEHILTSKQGCDSMVTLYLFVHPEYHPAPLYFKLCGSSSYDFYGQTLDTAGIYTHTLTSKHGCDSVITLRLETGVEFVNLITASICEGETYNQHGFLKSVSGLDSITYLATNGCDSVVVLDLTVFPSYTGAQAITKYDTVCQGAGYNNYGFTLTVAETNTSGTITRTHNNLTINGCDSIVTLCLTIDSVYHTVLYDQPCHGNHYVKHGFNLPDNLMAGTHTFELPLTSKRGCDSLVTLHLTINPVKTTAFSDDICINSDYQQHGFTISAAETAQAGILYDSLFLHTMHGCDSTVTLELIIHPLYADTLTVNACDSYFWENTNCMISGTYTQHYQNQYGCDSAKTLQLTLHYTSPVTHFNDTARGGFTYENHGFAIAVPSQVSDDISDTLHLTNSTGCDSTITLRLHVLPMQYDTAYHYYCQRDSYIWQDSTYYEGHSFTDTLFAVNSIHIIITHFIENEAPIHEFTIIDCNPYIWSDSTCSASGDYTRTYPLPTGCDSTVILHFTRLMANQPPPVHDTVCPNIGYQSLHFNLPPDSMQIVGEHHFTQFIHDNTYICPTSIEAYIYVKPSYLFEESYEFCENEGFYEWHGQQLTQSGIYWDSLQTTLNCDSVYRLQFTVYPSYLINYQRTFCDNVTYSWRGQSITESGIYWDSLATIHGCDSLYRLEAAVNSTYLIITDTTICEIENVLWQGLHYDSTGVYTVHHNTCSGCDSVHQLHLTVLPVITLDSSLTICEGETVLWGNEVAETTGIYTQYLTNAWHCDTVCLLHLTINPVNQTDLHYTAAIGDTVDYQGFLITGEILEETGEYRLERLLTNQYGCDSIVRLYLTVSGITEVETHHIRIYPNPASDRFTIENEQGILKNIAIYDLTGRLIEQIDAVNNSTVSIFADHWVKGVYIIKIDIGNAVLIRKIVLN